MDIFDAFIALLEDLIFRLTFVLGEFREFLDEVLGRN